MTGTQIILVPTKQTVQYVEQSVNNVIILKTYVSAIKGIYQALGAADSDLLITIREVSTHPKDGTLQGLIDLGVLPRGTSCGGATH